jgi:hypothetical protein
MSVAAGAPDGFRGAGARTSAASRGESSPELLESILLDPAPERWALRAQAPDAAARVFREQLGLPAGRVVMSGHQAGLWHCGILAKWFALEQVAGRAGASAVWLVVDTDDNEPTVLNYPARRVEDGRLEVRQWQAAPGLVVRPGTPTGGRDAIDPAPPPRSGRSVEVPELVSTGLARAVEALRGRRGSPSLAEQFARAAGDLIEQAAGRSAPTLMFASAVGRTEFFGDVVQRMVDDPAACARAYNAAVGAHPEAQLRPLDVSGQGGRIELPLWRMKRGSPRQAVYASELAGGTVEGELAPRALLLTGLLRLAGCDLFIHGSGGGVYDRVTDAWLGSWLRAELAPSVVASATWLLPLEDTPPPAPRELARAQWERHAAKHNPGLVGDRAAAERKRDLVGAIARAEPGDVRRAALYRDMHDLLEQVRSQHEPEMARLQDRAAYLRERLRDGEILLDRTWPFVLFPEERLRELRARIHEALA